MTKRACGSRERIVSMASIAASFPSAKSRGTLLSAAMSRLGLLWGAIDQLVPCLGQLLAFRVGKLVHQRAVFLYDQRTFAFLLAPGFAAFHIFKLRRDASHVNDKFLLFIRLVSAATRPKVARRCDRDVRASRRGFRRRPNSNDEHPQQ